MTVDAGNAMTSPPAPWRVLGVDFAPLLLPVERRMQTVGAINWLASFMLLGFGSLFLCLYMLVATTYWWIPLLYGVWYLYDRHTPSRGGRHGIPWFRQMRVWRWMSDYFPIRLVRTTHLSPDRNYILGYHPHGILCTGAFCNFATDATGFHALFPGLRPILLTLAGQYSFPFFREYFMTTGSCACSRESIDWLLTKEGTGNALVLPVGGAAEVFESRPGNFTLMASSRKGFIKIALKHGTPLVPMFSFGENDIYDQTPNPPGSRLRRVQERMRKIFGFASPLFQGRGIFQYTFGLLPHRRPITTVVGAPVEMEKLPDPTSAQIEDAHARYFKALEELFETHKEDYGVSPDTHLKLM